MNSTHEHRQTTSKESAIKKEKWSVRELIFAFTTAFLLGVTVVVVTQASSRQFIDWAGIASITSALFTGGSVIFAVVVFRHEVKRREQDDANTKRMAARGVLFSSSRDFTGQTIFTEKSESESESDIRDTGRGTSLTFSSVFTATATVENTSLQPIFRVTLIAVMPPNIDEDEGQLFPPGMIDAMKPQSTSLPLSLTCILEEGSEILDDRVSLEVRFTDIWGQRWATNGLDTYTISAQQERNEPNYD